ncbi:MAG TPA: UDP-glucuronic acid decarboxylase family protein [Gemmatimonadales bacterium]|nr:UDP-glucuronic acid decarboxylase family protein [Gemmatimonadales bacterium]
MRILVAGGAGFVGSHLCARLLEHGHDVVVVDNFLTGRWRNLEPMRRGPHRAHLEVQLQDVCEPVRVRPPVAAVLHLASPASPVDYLRHPLETLDAGAAGTRNLLALAHRDGARFLLASTSEVYGDPEVHPQPESYWGHVNPVGPRSVYDEAKRYAEAMASAWARHAGVRVRIARIFNTYGPGMRLDDGRVIPSFASQALRGDPLTVHGDGSQTRSYCYVSDLVDGLLRLLWSDVEGPVNLGNPEELTVRETAERIRDAVGSASPIQFHPLPEDDPRLRRPDVTRATTLLGWHPQVPFAEGIARTAADIAGRLAAAPQPHANGVHANGATNGRTAHPVPRELSVNGVAPRGPRPSIHGRPSVEAGGRLE